MDIKDCKRGLWNPTFHDADDIQAIRKALSDDGCAFVDGCGGSLPLVRLSTQLGRIVKPRNEVGAGTGVSNIRYAPGIEGKGYSSEELFFHTDRSGWDLPPGLLITTLKVKSETGGEALLVDGHAVMEAIKAQDTKLFDIITNSRYSSFRADDGTFIPRPLFDLKTGMLRFRLDDGVQLSASLIEALPLLRELIYQYASPVSLEPGQCYIVDNHRFLHGRTSFTGARELLRVLANPYPRAQIKTILFDVDGTLCRSEALSKDAYYRCVSDVIGKSVTHENTNVNLHGQTDLSLIRDILRYHGLDDTAIEPAVRSFLGLHPQYLKESLAKGYRSECCPEANALLGWLAAKKQQQANQSPNREELTVCIGLLTGNSRPNALLKIRAAGIDPGWFDLGISAFGDTCVNREGLVTDSMGKLEERYGRKIDARNITLVGDTPLDISCAKSKGCGIVAVATGNYTSGQLAPLAPDLLCEGLAEAKGYLSASVFGL